jgi:hypothetical protein
MRIGTRVRVVSGMPEFVGQTGEVVSTERDGQTLMNRVRLDRPVIVPSVGLVEDDLWSSDHLRRVR